MPFVPEIASHTSQQNFLNAFELAAQAGDPAATRAALRKYLFDTMGEKCEGSLGEAIAAIAANPAGADAAATVVLRALAIPGVIQDNAANKIDRHIVALVEATLPSICAFLGLQPKMQTFEKFAVLQNAYRSFADRLAPLKTPFTTIDSILASKANLQSGLKHGQVRQFFRIYRIAEIADAIDSLLAKMARVHGMEVSLSDDVESCHRDIFAARELVRNSPSLLTNDYLQPFLDSASRAIDTFISNVRGRFSSKIVRGVGGVELQKRYTLHAEGREIRIAVPMRNEGPGVATDVTFRISSSSPHVAVCNGEVRLGTVAPGNFSVGIDVLVVEPCTSFDAEIYVSWGELGGTKPSEELFEVRALAQRADIEWSKYRYWNPYSTAPAEGEGFVGRKEQVHALVSRMLQTPMEPTYIDGQKRVGKTSLAHAAVDEAERCASDEKVRKCYILWGNIAHENPRVSLKRLGEEIEGFIHSSLPGGGLLSKADFDGSLSPLIALSAHAMAVDTHLRFVVIVDEFDEMPQELYLQGNLAETFFANIRAITASPNLCLLLVGGENMPYVMERQGQKLNKFSRVNLTYFSRETEWEDFKRLVREPTAGVLVWHDDAISEIFNLTNGNPYFAKIVCKEVTLRAVEERDADITGDEVKRAMDARISRLEANLFAHLWQDGVPAPADEREPIYLKRRRALAALARCQRYGQSATLANIYNHCGGGQLSDGELASLLANFVSRDVLIEQQGEYHFVLPIFGMWAVDVGLSRLANDGLAEELAAISLRLDDEAHVLSEEIVALTDSAAWQPYRGRRVGPEEVRAWLSQRSSSREQRLLFTLLKAVRIVGMEEILQRLRTAGNVIRETLGVPTRRKLSDRRTDVIVTYIDGEGKSGQRYAADFAEENKIDVKAIISPASFRRDYEAFQKAFGTPLGIVIIDDIVGTGGSLAGNLRSFVEQNADLLAEAKPIIQAFALFGTVEGCDRVRAALGDLDYPNIDFRVGETLSPQSFAFEGPTGIFATTDDFERAKALVTDIGVTIYRKQPLGFGQQGLLLVLPMTVPNNTLPLLHSHSKGDKPGWRPLFERLTN